MTSSLLPHKYCIRLLLAAVVTIGVVSFGHAEEETGVSGAVVDGPPLPEAVPAEKVVDLSQRRRQKPAPPQGTFQDAMKLYNDGKLDQAQAILERIAGENPVDKESRRYLKSILSMKRKLAARDQHIVQRDRILDVRRSWLPIERSGEEALSQEGDSSTARQKWMEERLRQVIPEINFNDARLSDIIAYLSKLSGINMILDEELGDTGEEYVEEIEAGTDQAQNAGNRPGQGKGGGAGVTIALKNVPLIEALRYILTPMGLKYRVDEYAILISTPAKLESGDMETRYYHLASGSGTFVSVRKAKQGIKQTTESKESTLTIKEVLEQSGVPFPPGSKIFLDARTGTLIVRNTPGNLAVVEKIVGALDISPFQVAIESKFVDIEESTARELGLESFLTRNFPLSFTTNPNDVISASAGNANAGQFTNSTVANEGFSRGLRFLQTAAGAPRGNVFSFASVLTQPQFQLVLHALDQSGMANILSAPKVTTANNQQARIEVVTQLYYPTQFEITPATTNDFGTVITPPVVIPGGFTSRDVGITLEVTPSVGNDRKTISLTLIPEVSTLAAWQDFGISVGSNFPAIPILQPVFTSKNVTASIVINDTETVVLGGLIKEDTTTTADKVPVLGDIPFIGGGFRSNTSTSTKKNLLIFVTAYMLSPEGETIKGPYYEKTKIFNP